MKMIKNNIIGIKSYLNANELKAIVLKENKNKSGIYRWTNKINNKIYIGSAVKLNERLSNYYNINFQNIKHRSLIKNAILKYKISNFSIDILEYCDKDTLLKREQYYIDNMKPEYNILKIAGSRLGHKLSMETKLKISRQLIGKKRPMYGKPISKEILKKRVEFHKCNILTLEAKNRLALTNKGITVKVYDNTNNLIKKFSSIKETAKYYNVGVKFIRKYLDNNKNFQGFTIKSEIKSKKDRVGLRPGYKLSMETKLKISRQLIGKKHPMYGKPISKEILKKRAEFYKYNKMTLEFRNRLALTNKGIIVKVYDNTNNLVKKFSSIKETAEYYNVGVGFIRKYLDNNKNFQGYILKSELKNNKVGIFNAKNELIEALDNAAKISKVYNIPRTTLHKYIKTSKLYKDKYYFYKIN